MGNRLLEDLRAEIAGGDCVLVVGAGVSISASGGASLAGWTGLLEHGATRCEDVAQPLPPGWAERVRGEIASGDVDELLSAAEKIATRLDAPGGGEYARWLKESVGSLRVSHPEAIEALALLGTPIVTTNYDGLIEQVTGLAPVTWKDTGRVEQVLRQDEPGVVHLHGHWQAPDTVVLGIRSYEHVLHHEHAQAMLGALRSMRTLVFIGYGAGLSDPNFGALLRWTRRVFAGSPYRHYRLVDDASLCAVQAQHPPEERIFALSYGTYAQLPGFLRGLGGSGRRGAAGRPSPGGPARLPVAPLCIGRDVEVETLARRLVACGAPVCILGAPGIGKSTVALAALHRPEVRTRFGARRFFIRCDGARGAEALVQEIARNLGIAGDNLEARVFAELERAPAGLVLDNLETPWEAEPDATMERMRLLAGLGGLSLAVALRGANRPPGMPWGEALALERVAPEDARSIFVHHAPRQDRDPLLGELLGALDGLPLAIELMALLAESEPDLRGLKARWERERTEMLRRFGAGPQASLGASLELSIAGPRMTAEARRLLPLVALLPDGCAHDDLSELLPRSGETAASTLRQVGLAFDEGGTRLRLLAPVREHVRLLHAPEGEDRDRTLACYVGIARSLGPRVGGEGGADAARRLGSELRNLEATLGQALESADPRPAIDASVALAEFMRFSGLGGTSTLERATEESRLIGDAHREANCIKSLGDIALARSDHDAARARFEEALPLYRRVGNVLGEANCIKSLGDIALGRSDHDAARARFEEALPLFRRVGDVLGEANCIKSLGNIALRRSDHDAARARFEEALPLFRRVGDVLGEANCIRSLGDIALERSDYDPARARYEEALPLYRRVGSVLGEANCIQSLGDIALRRSDHDAARARFEEALPLFRRVGDVLGEANCIRSLGDIALERSDYDPARARYEEALPLYRRVGDVLGEANCIQSLGDIALRRSDHDAARARFEEALALYTRIHEPYSIGWTLVCIARVAGGAADHDRHLAAARDAWRSIGRDDLIEKLDHGEII